MPPKKQKRPQVDGGANKTHRDRNYRLIRKAAQVIIFEGTVVAFAGSALADGTLTERDRQRALESVARINGAIKIIRGVA